jgi:hypothetical protein
VQFNDEYNISQKLHIEVRSSGFEENFPPVTSTIEGEMFDLPCSPEDKNAALYWIVFGEKMKPGEKKDRFSVDANDGTLVISRARIEDNGLIKCIAGNKSIETNLHVLKDRSVTKQKNLDKIIESESVELVCELEGKRVTWSQNGEVNEQNARKRKVFTEISVSFLKSKKFGNKESTLAQILTNHFRWLTVVNGFAKLKTAHATNLSSVSIQVSNDKF